MRTLSFFLLAFILFSCSNKEEEGTTNEKLETNVWISGQIKNLENKTVKLIVTLDQGPITLGETTSDKKGNFKLEGSINGFGIYQVLFGEGQDKSLPLPLNVNDKLEISGDFSTIEKEPTFKGTNWSNYLTDFFGVFNEFASKQERIIVNPSISDENKLEQIIDLKKPLDEFVISAIKKDPANEANIIFYNALLPSMGYEFWDESNLEIVKLMADAYQEKYTDSPFGRSIPNQYAQLEREYNEFVEYQKNGGGAQATGGKAPDIALANPDGKVMRLSELKGKYVLIDFWASWCAPCRRENPNVVRLYDKYSSKGFEIFSVSLDKDGNAWKRAIESDNLKWKFHVSDLKQWESSVIPLYGFNAIPHTVLINPKGDIIATNLRGESLERKLSELFD